jgi:hypothetical protein
MSRENFYWLLDHASEISNQYIARYGKDHKSNSVLVWCIIRESQLKFEFSGLQKFAIAINEDCLCRKELEFDVSDPITCYRLYYKIDKKHIHSWKAPSCAPPWI